jgi:hypothetical protein
MFSRSVGREATSGKFRYGKYLTPRRDAVAPYITVYRKLQHSVALRIAYLIYPSTIIWMNADYFQKHVFSVK